VNGARVGERVSLRPEDDFTGVIPIEGLEPATRHQIDARFLPLNSDMGDASAQGFVRTFPDDPNAPFRFLHGSCNLSIVRLSNIGAMAAGLLGTLAAASSGPGRVVSSGC
jgi:hypothetical protein